MKTRLVSAFRELKNGNPGNALKILDGIIAENPNVFEYYLIRGKARKITNDLQGSLSDFNAAILLKSNSAIAHNYRAELLYSIGYYERALMDITEANRIYPECLFILFNRGSMECKLKMYSDALVSFNRVIELNKSFLPAYLKRGILHEKLGNNAESVSDFSYVIKCDKRCASAYYFRGNLLLNKMNETAKGKRDLDKAFKLRSENTETRESIAGITQTAMKVQNNSAGKRQRNKLITGYRMIKDSAEDLQHSLSWL